MFWHECSSNWVWSQASKTCTSTKPQHINILFLLSILFLQVFEDDCILSQATDSGCPSESLLEDEGTAEKQNVDLLASSNHPKGKPTSLTWRRRFDQLLTKGLRSKRTINLSSASSSDPPSPIPHPPPPSSPTHEHLGLEWDPSVDIGRSVSRDDADSSYFSASTGKKRQNRCLTLHGNTALRNQRWHRENADLFCQQDVFFPAGLKRWSYLSSFDSQSDISADIRNQEGDLVS